MLSTFPLIHNMPTWTTHAHTPNLFFSFTSPYLSKYQPLSLFIFQLRLTASFLSLSYTHYWENLVSASYSPMSSPSFFFLSFLFFLPTRFWPFSQGGSIFLRLSVWSLRMRHRETKRGERVDSERKMVYKKEGEGERYWRKGKRNRRMEKIDCIKRKKRKEEGQKEWWLPWNDSESEACVLIMGCFMAQLFLTLHLN